MLRAWEGYPLDHQWGHKQVNDRLHLQWSGRRQLLHQLQRLTAAGLLQHHIATRKNGVVGKWSLTRLGEACLHANLLQNLHLPPSASTAQPPAVPAPASAVVVVPSTPSSPPHLRPSSPLPLSPSTPASPSPILDTVVIPECPLAALVNDEEAEATPAAREQIIWLSQEDEDSEENHSEEQIQVCSKCNAQQPLISLTCGCPPIMCERCFSVYLAQHKSKYGSRAKYCCTVCKAPAARL